MVQYDKMSEEEEAQYASPSEITAQPTPEKRGFWDYAKKKSASNVKAVVDFAKKKKSERDSRIAAEKAAYDALSPEEKARVKAEKERLAAGRQKVVAQALGNFGVSEEPSRPIRSQSQRDPFSDMFGGGSGGYSTSAPDFGIGSPTMRGKKSGLPGPVSNPLDAMFSTPKPTRGIKPPKSGVVGSDYFGRMGIGDAMQGTRMVKGKKVKSVTFRF